MQYAVACFNSINSKGGGTGDTNATKEKAAQEARDCKNHVQQNIQIEGIK